MCGDGDGGGGWGGWGVADEDVLAGRPGRRSGRPRAKATRRSRVSRPLDPAGVPVLRLEQMPPASGRLLRHGCCYREQQEPQLEGRHSSQGVRATHTTFIESSQ